MILGNEYLKVVQERFKSVKIFDEKTIDQLYEKDLNWKLNEASNSIAIIVKHIEGNMVSRWGNT